MALSRRAILVGGRWIETAETAAIRDPYSGETLADVCLAGEAEIEEATKSAVAAFALSRHLPSHTRAAALQSVANVLASRHEEFATCLSAESAKPITDARREVGRAISTFTIAGEEANAWYGPVPRHHPTFSNRAHPWYYAV